MTTETTTVADEIAAMRRIVAALDKLDEQAQTRVVVWLCQRYLEAVEVEVQRIRESP